MYFLHFLINAFLCFFTAIEASRSLNFGQNVTRGKLLQFATELGLSKGALVVILSVTVFPLRQCISRGIGTVLYVGYYLVTCNILFTFEIALDYIILSL